MNKILAVFAVLALMAAPALAQHEGMKGHGGMEMKSTGMKHDDMSGMGKLVYKGESKGIKVKAYLNDMKSAMKAAEKTSGMKMDMSKMDPNLTHHIAVMIEESKDSGKVKSASLKLTLNDKAKDYELMSMHGHYGADVSLKEKGSYKAELTVDTEKTGIRLFSFSLKN